MEAESARVEQVRAERAAPIADRQEEGLAAGSETPAYLGVPVDVFNDTQSTISFSNQAPRDTYSLAGASTVPLLLLSLNQAAEATSAVPASITTPQNTISPMRLVPSPAIAA